MMTEGTTLELMERTLKIIVSGSRQNIQQCTRKNIVDLVKDDGAEAVWQVERGDQWFVTFKDSTIVDNWDGKSFKPPNANVTLHMYACDRLIIQCRLLWLPLWVTNDDIYRVLEKYGDIKDISYSIDVCCKYEGVGHLRHQCPHGDRPRFRSYASAVQCPVVGKRGEESVGRTPLQAVSKPLGEEPSASPSNQGHSSGPQEGMVAIPTSPPQDNQEDHGSPNEGVEPVGSTPDGKGLESPDTEGDTEVSRMDIGRHTPGLGGVRGSSPQKTKTRRAGPSHLPPCGSTVASVPVKIR